MKTKFNILSLNLFIFSLMIACGNAESEGQQESVYVTAESGLRYALHKNDAERKAKIGDVLIVHLEARADTLELLNTRKEGRPKHILVSNPSFKGSFEEGLFMIGKGDSATFICSADKVFKHVYGDDIPTRLKEGSDMVYQIEVLDLRNEDEEIQAHLQARGNDFEQTPLGYFQKIISSGSGRPVKKGHTVQINFKLQLLNGEVVNQTQPGGVPLSFKVGERKLIEGIEEAVINKNVGTRLHLIIPSFLAYSERPYLNVPPFTPIECFIEIVESDDG